MPRTEFSNMSDTLYGTEVTYNAGEDVEVRASAEDTEPIFTIPEGFSISETMTKNEETGDITCSLKINNEKFNFLSVCSHGLQRDRKTLWEIVFHGIENYNRGNN